eukprot:TRINITY_DN32542_c0_g1_i1.p1 TRINITY_DN32542_c0_g1~~TRINITY_DN32542_c0_g1_i1.p1  ORF type:complete len:288 (+),score=51.98 TRINITY_DN32542_c0_g1_i1:71-934(+)
MAGGGTLSENVLLDLMSMDVDPADRIAAEDTAIDDMLADLAASQPAAALADEVIETSDGITVPLRSSAGAVAAKQMEVKQQTEAQLAHAHELATRPDDLPLDPKLELPDDVSVRPTSMVCSFNLCCAVDLKQICFKIRHAEFNPRKQSAVTLRLIEPSCTTLIMPSGKCVISGSTDVDTMKQGAKKVARMVQKCSSDVKFADFRVTSLLCTARLGFPVRLDILAAKWRKHAVYEPEFYSGACFKTLKPKRAYNVTAGGCVNIAGCKTLHEADEALRRIYPVLRDLPR